MRELIFHPSRERATTTSGDYVGRFSFFGLGVAVEVASEYIVNTEIIKEFHERV
jgi:hypothetical protein